MKKNNTAEKAVLEAEKLSQALKEGTQKSLKNMVNEAINKMITESEDDEDDYDVEDVDDDVDTPDTDNDTNCKDGECCADGECKEAPEDDAESTEDDATEGEDNDEWSDMEQYKVGDNDYDLTNADGDVILKVYNKLGDDDQIVVKKDEDGNYNVKDNETGAEYVIELNDDADIDSEDSFDDYSDDDDTDIDVEFDDDMDDDYDSDDDIDIDIEDNDDDYSDDDDTDIDVEFDDDMDDDYDSGDDSDEDMEFEITDDDDNEDERNMVNEENLGYTDSYQKDVMPGLSMKEPADKKATYSMDGGAPDGTSRPYSGYENKESNCFNKKTGTDLAEGDIPGVDAGTAVPTTPSTPTTPELEETATLRARTQTKRVDAKTPRNHREYKGQVSHDELNEAYMKRIVNKAKQIQNENKQYANALNGIKKSLKEAAVLNVSLAKIVQLLSENTTNANEKKSIVDRFKNVTTIKESKALYDTIKAELNNNNSNSVMLEHQISMNGSNVLNETKMYQNNAKNPALSLMERMDNLYK